MIKITLIKNIYKDQLKQRLYQFYYFMLNIKFLIPYATLSYPQQVMTVVMSTLHKKTKTDNFVPGHIISHTVIIIEKYKDL